MTFPYPSSHKANAPGKFPWGPHYYNDPLIDVSTFDSLIPVDIIALKHYPTYSSNPHHFPSAMDDSQGQLQEDWIAQFLLRNLVLQELRMDSLFNPSFNERGSSCGSSSFEFQDFNSFISPPTDLASAPKVTAGTFAVTEKPPTPKIRKHKRKHITTRSKLGCWICRIKHLKCDESKPICANCTRFGLECDYSEERPAYVSDRNLRRQKLDAIIMKKRRRVEFPLFGFQQCSVAPQGTTPFDDTYSSRNEWLFLLADI